MIPILSGNVASALPSGYEVANSCRFNVGDDEKLTRTAPNSSATHDDKFTFSLWVKRSVLGAIQQIYSTFDGGGAPYQEFQFYFKDTDQLRIQTYNGSNQMELIPNRRFRDVSAWYHFVFAYDSSQGTASNRAKLYVNGVQETSFATETYPAQNTDGEFAIQNHIQAIGNNTANSRDSGMYLAEMVGVDGQALAPTEFGEFDEDSPTIWKPKDVSGINVGTLGFYLDFEDSSALGNDVSGVGDFTVTNLDATNQSTDTCTNNFATMNPLDGFSNSTFSQGNLQTLSDNPAPATSTIGLTSGKWWIEAKAVSTSGSGSDYQIGIVSNQVIATEDIGHYSNNYQYYYNGQIRTGNSGSSYGDTYTHGDIIGVALNLDDNELQFYKNGTVQNSGTAISITAPASTSLGAYFFALGADANANKYTWHINFGNPIYSLTSAVADANGYGSFEHAPPSGFFSVCTKNLAEYG